MKIRILRENILVPQFDIKSNSSFPVLIFHIKGGTPVNFRIKDYNELTPKEKQWMAVFKVSALGKEDNIFTRLISGYVEDEYEVYRKLKQMYGDFDKFGYIEER